MTDPDILLLPRIEHQILVIRGQKVMVDADLAALYGVPTKALKQAVNEILRVSHPLYVSAH